MVCNFFNLKYIPKQQKNQKRIVKRCKKGSNWNNLRSHRKIRVVLILGASGTVTIMSPDGTPVQVNASALQAASAQNAVGMSNSIV